MAASPLAGLTMSRLLASALLLLSLLTAVAVSSAAVEISKENELLAKIDELQRENTELKSMLKNGKSALLFPLSSSRAPLQFLTYIETSNCRYLYNGVRKNE